MRATASLESLVQRSMQQHRLPGLAVAIHRNGIEEFAAGYGHCDAACESSITADTMFGVASVTKMVTAMIVMQLAEQKQLSVFDSVAAHFPQLQVAQNAPMQLVHLLSHSAGFPGLPSRFSARNLANSVDNSGGVPSASRQARRSDSPTHQKLLSADELVDFINQQQLSHISPPGQRLNYSNDGFCLLGGVIEKLTQSSYVDAVRDRVFAPLGMTRSAVGAQTLAHFDNVAKPLLRIGDGFVDSEQWDAPLFYPAGGVIASPRDLVKMLKVFDTRQAILGGETIEQMVTPRIDVSSRSDHGVHYGYGLGVELTTIDANNRLLWHTGQRAGISSFVGRLLKQKVDIALVCNVADAPTASIGYRLASLMLGQDDYVWPPIQRVDEQSKSHRSCHLSSTMQKEMSGCYGSHEGFVFTVEQQAGGLILNSSTTRDPLVFFDDDSGVAGEQTFRFLKDENGFAYALALDLRIFERWPKV